MCLAGEWWVGNGDFPLWKWFGNNSASWLRAGFKGRIETRRGKEGVGLYFGDNGHDAQRD